MIVRNILLLILKVDYIDSIIWLLAWPAIFQSTIDQVLQGIPKVWCYLDNILVVTANEVEHKKILDQVFSRLEQYNVKAKREKREFFYKIFKYLGHMVDGDGIHPTDEKVQDFTNDPTPSDLTECCLIKRFLIK